MRRILVLGGLVLAGCARFPRNGSSNDFTRLTFRFTMTGPVNTDYFYAVAIRPMIAPATDDRMGPVPLYQAGTPNGYVTGRATRLVLFHDHQYQVLSFVNPPSDPTDLDPGTLTDTGDQPILSLDPSTDGHPRTLGFTIDTAYLVDDKSTAQSVYAIQFNILTMDRRALSSGDVALRHFDALGDQRLGPIAGQGYFSANITTGGSFPVGSNSNEPENDVVNVPSGVFPPLDISSWSLEVLNP